MASRKMFYCSLQVLLIEECYCVLVLGIFGDRACCGVARMQWVCCVLVCGADRWDIALVDVLVVGCCTRFSRQNVVGSWILKFLVF